MISLNHRLKVVSQYLLSNSLADIGSDHAYLPIYALQHHLCDDAIAGRIKDLIQLLKECSTASTYSTYRCSIR